MLPGLLRGRRFQEYGGAVHQMDRREFLTAAALAMPATALLNPLAHLAKTPDIAALRKAVRGTVYTRSTNGFTRARTIYNTRYAGSVPLVVVRAASVADVQATVRWAAEQGVPITARSGGHSYGGYSTVSGGVVVDMRSLSAVRPSGRTAQIGAGATLMSVYATLAGKGTTIPAGSCPTVGFAGHAQGGGMGLAGRQFGLTLDNVTGVQLVTADGKARNVDRNTNSDLFWAVRGGGGGNFGIATSFNVTTHPVSSASWFFASWPWSEAADVLGAWQTWVPRAPAALTSICSLLSNPGGSPRVTVLGQYFGTQASLRSVLSPLLRDAPGSSLSIGTADYLDLQKRWAGCLGQSVAQCSAFAPTSFAAKSDYVVKAMPTTGRRAAVSALERREGAGSIIFDSYGGAINRVGTTSTAFVHRNALCGVQYISYFNRSGAGAAAAWLKAAATGLRPYVSGRAYVNYIDPTLAGYETAYYGKNLPRLRSVKKKYDGANLFRFAQQITPAP